MKKAYVLMYWSDEDGMVNVPTGEKSPPKLKPYAVFEDKFTAEKMKREGDEVVEVPYFDDPIERAVQAIERCKDEKSLLIPSVPCETHITYQHPEHHPDSTLAPFPPPNYPKVTCSKTVDEHKWTNRVD